MANLDGFLPPLPPPKRSNFPQSTLSRIDKIIGEATRGPEFDQMLSFLTAPEKELFWAEVQRMRENHDLNIEDLWKIDYLREPPSIKDFIEDDYWMGSWCRKPVDGDGGLFPAWRDVLLSDWDRDSRLHNAVITGSLGIGKSIISVLLMLYRIACAKCMRNPQSFLALARGSAIMYVMLSVTRAAVTDTVWGDAKNLMANSPFFIEECGFKPEKKYANLSIPLGSGLILSAGSRGQHILGRNTMGVLLDEGNWRLEASPDLKAYALFDEVRQRLKNRFQKISGYLPALSLLASSARDESSFTESVINDIRQVNDDKVEKVYRFAQFRIKRHALRLGKKWFRVEYGIKNQEPRILSGWVFESGLPMPGEVIEQQNSGGQVEIVPEMYHQDFQRNIKTSLQSICGVSTGGSHRLFPSTELLEKANKAGAAAGLVNPCKLNLIPISDDDDKNVWDYLDHKSFLTRIKGHIVPLRDTAAMRYAHLDLATANVCGLAICHQVGTRRIDGLYNRETGKVFAEYRKLVAYDFLIAITAGQYKPISIKKVQDFIFWLRDMCGFRFGKITADTYQSVMPIQIFEERGIPAEVLSMDKNKIPYYAWRTGFEESRILTYEHPVLMREVEYLIDHPSGKIDHPAETPYGPGTKDLSDAGAGAYFSCITDGEAVSANSSPSDVAVYGNEAPDAGEEAPVLVMPRIIAAPHPTENYSV